jgi:hypothetical protein
MSFAENLLQAYFVVVGATCGCLIMLYVDWLIAGHRPPRWWVAVGVIVGIIAASAAWPIGIPIELWHWRKRRKGKVIA